MRKIRRMRRMRRITQKRSGRQFDFQACSTLDNNVIFNFFCHCCFCFRQHFVVIIDINLCTVHPMLHSGIVEDVKEPLDRGWEVVRHLVMMITVMVMVMMFLLMLMHMIFMATMKILDDDNNE